ncbi:hypothetical protein DYB32_009006 [Aphanomyces invadans]|uniref:PH domain-containing protein n=1 Tax=Aphanomyces invadans TaxID=157072 RepID=A0A3R6YT28_9STRA|nr:hypothetical protein DYB32_009006 [Aphanomyces invadans]
MALTRRTSSFLSMRSGTATNILTEVQMATDLDVARASLLIEVVITVDINVADLLAQLALYCMMGGEYDEALPLLHRKLVIHEKFGPDECVGDTLQQLGTAYRLYANHALAVQHLEKALDRREKAAVATRSRKDHEKVAETLNSLALVHHMYASSFASVFSFCLVAHSQGNAAVADAYHSRSVETYAMWAGADDGQSEDIPWEVFKRVQSEKSTPTMAQNSMTLLKTNLRMAIQDVALPVVEGYLEKKSSSLFRGWEKRWFKVDTRTAVMTYFHSKEDHMRGFAPRGTFALARISHIVTHQHLRYVRHFVVGHGTSSRLNAMDVQRQPLRL